MIDAGAAPGSPLLSAFDQQVVWCSRNAPFTARVIERSRHWLAENASAHAALAALATDPGAGAVPLRWAAALHRLALLGRAPWAALWPPAEAAATPADGEIDASIRLAWRQHRGELDDWLSRPPQTNEVGRSAVLLPGLLQLAAEAGQPLMLLEIGASAGLNLWCDRWRHEHGAWAWGDAAAPLALHAEWRGPPPVAQGSLKIAGRRACDLDPIDLAAPLAAVQLASYVWADERGRLARLQSAAQAAAAWMAAEGIHVERRGAADFVREAIAAAPAGSLPVLLHSIVWQYLGAAEQAAVSVAYAAAAATRDVAWLRLEPPGPNLGPDLVLQRGLQAPRTLAHAHPHGQWIEWLGAVAPGAA